MKRLALAAFVFVIAPALHAGPALRVQFYPSANQVWLTWTDVPGTASYAVERTSSYPAWSLQAIHGPGATGWLQSGLSANTTYIYRIVPRDGAGNPFGTASNPAIVATHPFADNPLDLEGLVKLQHIIDLRTAVASVRAAAGAGSAVWTNNPLTIDSLIAGEDVNDLRNNLNAAFSNLGLPLPSYVDPSLAGQLIRRVHFQQLRDLARAYPEQVIAGSAVVSEPYFSPNGDGVKDTTTFSASVVFAAGPQRVDFRWRVDVRNQTNSVVVRSAFGSGTAVAFVWDGKDGVGAVQPEALYAFELIDLDSLPLAVAGSSARLDITPPTATIAAPADAFVVSNVRMAGGGSVAVTGSASDQTALQQWTLERTGNSQSAVTINSGTTNVASGSLGTWQTLPSSGALPNGDYTLELTVTDKAGNTVVDTVPVTVGHFSASRSSSQANAAAGGSVTYTSVVPFPLQLRVDIWRGSTLVRTLVNGLSQAETRNDIWDLGDAPLPQGQLVPDGAYRYIATATDGTFSLTWDKSGAFPAGPATNQFEYPKCWTGTAWVSCGQAPADLNFDPYGGTPLRIAYCVGGGDPDTGCTGSDPAYVIGKVTIEAETTDVCGDCFISEYQAAGRQEVLWYGLGLSANYIADRPRLTVIRKFTSVAANMTLVYGTAPTITNVAIAPGMFSPPSVPLPVGGQTFTLSVTSFNSRSVSVTASFYSMEFGSLLRTITTALQPDGDVTLTWDGRAADPAATLVAPGHYAVTLVVTDEVGSKTTVRPIIVVRY